MVEMKEPKETRAPDATRLVEESMARLHDMERRLHAVQGHLSGLVNMANALYQTQPGGVGVPTGPAAPWTGFEQTAPSFGFGAARALPFFGAAQGAGPIGPTPFAGPPSLGPSVTPLMAPFASTSGQFAGPGLSARDFEKLPAVARVPEVNFIDSGDRYIIKVELPGVRKEDLDITISERMITVDAEARQEIGDGTVLVGEVIPTVYRRTIALPSSCNSTKGKANLKDGFLTLDVPKKEPTEGPRRLDVAYG